MGSRSTATFSTIAMLLLAPSLATATEPDVQRKLEVMRDRMREIEDQLRATTDEYESTAKRIDEQSAVIEEAGLAETRGASSGLPGFIIEMNLGGWVAGSYFWNWKDPN